MADPHIRARVKRGTAYDRVIDAATQLLIEGRGHLEIDQLAQAAGCSIGAIYHNFQSKAGVLAAVVSRYNQTVGSQIVPSSVSNERCVWMDSLREAVKSTATLMWREPLTYVIVQETIKDASAALEAERWLGCHVATLAEHLAQAQANGHLSKERDPELLAAGIAGGVRQIMRVLIARSEQQSLEKAHREIWAFVSCQIGKQGCP